MSTFATVEKETRTGAPAKVTTAAQTRLDGRRCVVAGIAPDPRKMSGSAPPHSIESALPAALLAALSQAGCAQLKYLTTAEAAEAANLAGYDTLILCAQATALRQRDAAAMWRTNVTDTRNACEAAERAGVKRIVLLGSILSLGHSPDGSPVNAQTPYLSDDKRTALEKSLLRQEMEVWQMAERGLEVSVVCGGINCRAEGWAGRIDTVKYARLLSTPVALAEALVVAAQDSMVDKRLICTGLSEALAKAESNGRGKGLSDILGLSETAMAERMLRRAGTYASDFAPAEE